MYQHDIHRLAHTGLRGWERIQRDKRHEAIMQKLGWAFLLLFLALTLIASLPS